MCEVILVASGKGGTGKTVVTSNLGALLAKAGKRVLLIDMDMGMRNLDLYLGMENRVVYNLMDVVSGLCRIRQAVIQDKRLDTLYLMSACPGKDDRDITPLHMKVLLKKLEDIFDYIIIDCPAGMGEGVEVVAEYANKALIVTEADIAALRDADILNRYIRQMGVEKTCFVVNKARVDLMEQGLVPSLHDIVSMMNCELVGIIQMDDNIFVSANQGIPISLKEGTYIEKSFRRLAQGVISL